MYCGNCGNQLRDIAIYCNRCRTKIPTPPEDPSPSAQKKKTLKEEYRTGILLWAFPILCFILTIFVFPPWRAHIYDLFQQGENNTDPLNRYSYAVWLINAAMLGTLTYTATRRSLRFTILASLPYVIQIVAGPFLIQLLAFDKYTAFSLQSLSENISYFGPLLCLAVLWITIFTTKSTLQKKKLHPIIQTIIFTLLSVFLFLARNILQNWSIFFELDILQEFRMEDQLADPIVLTLILTALATSTTLYFLHRKHDK